MVDDSALSAFVRRVQLRSRLTVDAVEALLALPSRLLPVPAGSELINPGERVEHSILVQDGLLGRFDLMRRGQRQITALHIPGDMCDLHSVVAPSAGWGLTALSGANVRCIAHRDIKQLAYTHPVLGLAFWRETTLDASILAKWSANIGRKSAEARLAHLLCETGIRMELAKLGERDRYRLHLTQEQLGDILALTAVHINRTLRRLKEQKLATVRRSEVEVHDWEALATCAEFSPEYLLLQADG